MIRIEIPEAIPSPFVVMTADPHIDAERIERIGPPIGPIVRDLLGTPLLEVSVYPAASSGLAGLLTSAAWARPDDRHFAEGMAYHVVVASHASPRAQPQHAQGARAVARAVAATDGIIYDSASHQVYPQGFGQAPEPGEFRLGDDWVAVYIDGYGREPLEVSTAGMGRFGLPELRAVGVPAARSSTSITLLRSVATGLLNRYGTLLAHHLDQRFFEVGSAEWIDVGDAWRFWGAAPPPDTRHVRVSLGAARGVSPDSRVYLTVRPPREHRASVRDWWETVVHPAMPRLPDATEAMAA